METSIPRSFRGLGPVTGIFLALIIFSSCKKNPDSLNGDVIQQNFTQTNLVANNSSYSGARSDANLVNAWGMAWSPTGNIWVSSAGAGKSTIYDKAGVEKLAAVTIPGASSATGGVPTGQVFNGSSDFVLPGGAVARFIFASADGTISGWGSGSAALKVVDNSSSSAYLGLAIASHEGNNYIYAADFRGGKIDVFNKNFAPVDMPFNDPGIPGGYAPFNIQNVSGLLFVTYALVNPDTHHEEMGPGLGYVSIFNPDGSFNRRFASKGALNAPWGVTIAPSTFMKNQGQVILIGNFGDGRILAYDMSGNYIGFLKRADGTAVEIEGLWGISFAPATATTVDPNWLFFAAGPNEENDGLFGYIN